SIQEGTIAKWHKGPGEPVARDDVLVDVETDKVVIEVVAPADGQLLEILKPEQEIVHAGEVLARFAEGAATISGSGKKAAAPDAPTEVAAPIAPAAAQVAGAAAGIASPAARKLAAERGLDLARIAGSGRDGRITREDVQGYRLPAATPAPEPEAPRVEAVPAGALPSAAAEPTGSRVERRVPMSRMRARMAERLQVGTRTPATLTTVNGGDQHRAEDAFSQAKDDICCGRH